MNSEQQEAFEYYLELGKERTHAKVATHFDIGLAKIMGWSDQYGWKGLIEDRIREAKWVNEGMSNEELQKVTMDGLERRQAVLEQKVNETVIKFQQLEQYVNKWVRTRNESNR